MPHNLNDASATLNTNAWLPSYIHHQEHMYILLTSLNLGGAEKIVSDQLWANHYSKSPKKITLIVIYDKELEHSLPPEVNLIRLNGKIENGELIFKQIAYDNKPLVCHLINDKISHYLFSLNVHIHLVIHNDKRGWSNTPEFLNHPNIISITAVAKFVKEQLEEIIHDKPVYKFRHNIKEHKFTFKNDVRIEKRKELSLNDDDIVIGMIGRICQQKNYFIALDVLANLLKTNPHYKLIILGGWEKQFLPLYMGLIQKINILKLHQNVIMPGFKTDPQNWMNVFDIGLNTSYFEGLSMATQEFMRNGLPMVLSRVCGQPEIIDQSQQLYFFELPEMLDTPETNQYHLHFDITGASERTKEQFELYLLQVATISSLVEKASIRQRIIFSDDEKKETSFLCYGSHNNWNLLNHIYPMPFKKDINIIKPAFITSNLSAGGAQRSLVNLLKQFKSNDLDIPLVLLNQSNQTQYFNEILEAKINYFLCHDSIDVFDISSNLFTYFHEQGINTIVFWNVDAKMKLLISKFFSAHIRIIDVSPGDYVLSEMENEIIFQDSIYYHDFEYFNELEYFVSKYDNRRYEQQYTKWLKNELKVIPNGVYFDPLLLTEKKELNPFKLLVCGRITESKHLETIFGAWKRLVTKYPNESLILEAYGGVQPHDVDYYNMLNETFSSLFDTNHIVWKGYHDNPKQIMKDYHAIVVLGTHQGSPNVVLEAGSCHLPVIANDSGGTREVINENTGWLLPEKIDEDALFEALDDLYSHYDLAWEKAKKCYQHIQDHFSMQKMADSYKEIIFEK